VKLETSLFLYMVVFLWSLRRCFPTRIQRKILRGSTINPGIYKCKFWNSAKNSNYHSKTSREFLSGIWQYWSIHRALPTASFVFVFLARGSWECDKIFSGFRLAEKVGKQGSDFHSTDENILFCRGTEILVTAVTKSLQWTEYKGNVCQQTFSFGAVYDISRHGFLLITKDCYSDSSPSSWRITSYLLSTATNLTHTPLRSTPGSLIPGTWITS
jgi:hypothetical protein